MRTIENQADVLELTLETRGASVNQSSAVTEHNRWKALIRAVGTGSPPHPSLTYSGGDVTDAQNDGTNVTWTLADFFDNLTVNPDDTYGSAPIGPTRNAAILQTLATGAFGSQLGGLGTAWLRAVENGGLPSGLWWPLTIAPHASGGAFSWIGCWYNDASITPDNPFGAYLDTHLVATVFGGYSSHVVCGFTDQKFFVECMRLSGTTMYILGGEFHPRIDQVQTFGVNPGYAQTSDLGQLRNQLDLTHRLARVAHASVGTVAAWEWWTGSGWSSSRANAVELRDTTGRLINGSAGIAEVSPGLWVMAAHQMVDPYLDVYNATGPQGPWARHARVPLSPAVGQPLNGMQDVFRIAWHSKVHTHFTSVPAGYSIVSLTLFPKTGSIPFTDLNIDMHAPIFAVVPWQ